MFKRIHFYDDRLDFEENKAHGPFGDFSEVNASDYNPEYPAYDFFGIQVNSPFGIADGPLPTPRFIKAALDTGFDIVTLKSVRTDTFPLNPYPQVRPLDLRTDLELKAGNTVTTSIDFVEPLAVANSFGIPSVKPDIWQSGMKASFALPKKGQALLVAFQGTVRGEGREAFVQDHVKGVDLITQTGATVIEVNLSCPNEGEEVLACFDTDITERIVHAIKNKFPDIKLIIKLAYFENKKQLRELVKRVGHKVDGISAINTVPARIVNPAGNEAFPGRPTAGVSGAPIKWAGLEMAGALNQLRRDFGMNFKILGMGGVLNAQDFHDYLDRGADFVMSVTGAMWYPNLAVDIKKSLQNSAHTGLNQ